MDTSHLYVIVLEDKVLTMSLDVCKHPIDFQLLKMSRSRDIINMVDICSTLIYVTIFVHCYLVLLISFCRGALLAIPCEPMADGLSD